MIGQNVTLRAHLTNNRSHVGCWRMKWGRLSFLFASWLAMLARNVGTTTMRSTPTNLPTIQLYITNVQTLVWAWIWACPRIIKHDADFLLVTIKSWSWPFTPTFRTRGRRVRLSLGLLPLGFLYLSTRWITFTNNFGNFALANWIGAIPTKWRWWGRRTTGL